MMSIKDWNDVLSEAKVMAESISNDYGITVLSEGYTDMTHYDKKGIVFSIFDIDGNLFYKYRTNTCTDIDDIRTAMKTKYNELLSEVQC